MLFIKVSNFQIIHTPGTNRTVADMLSRDFSEINNKICQIQHKTVPIHIDFIELKPSNSLNQIHYLVTHEVVLLTERNFAHPILVDYSDDQFTPII